MHVSMARERSALLNCNSGRRARDKERDARSVRMCVCTVIFHAKRWWEAVFRNSSELFCFVGENAEVS